MSTVSHGDHFEIFKFKDTGLVALCHEVSEFAQSDLPERWQIDLSSARFDTNEEQGTIRVLFDYLPEAGMEYCADCGAAFENHLPGGSRFRHCAFVKRD